MAWPSAFLHSITDRGCKRLHSAASKYMETGSEPGRARYKDVRTRPSNPLSAHQFFVCLCRKVLRTGFAQASVIAGLSPSYASMDTP